MLIQLSNVTLHYILYISFCHAYSYSFHIQWSTMHYYASLLCQKLRNSRGCNICSYPLFWFLLSSARFPGSKVLFGFAPISPLTPHFHPFSLSNHNCFLEPQNNHLYRKITSSTAFAVKQAQEPNLWFHNKLLDGLRVVQQLLLNSLWSNDEFSVMHPNELNWMMIVNSWLFNIQ